VTRKQFYDWQTAGGGGDVTLLIETLEREEIPWCVIGGLAVNHWAEEPMATVDVDLAISTDQIEKAVQSLEAAGFRSKRFEWSINVKGHSEVSTQITRAALSTRGAQKQIPISSSFNKGQKL
jgi:hypothetical protein